MTACSRPPRQPCSGNRVCLGGVDGILHACELRAYLVKDFSDGRTAGVHLLHRVASLVDVGGALHIQFVSHAVLLDLDEEPLAEVGTLLARNGVVLVHLGRSLRYHLHVLLAHDGQIGICCLFTHSCRLLGIRKCHHHHWPQDQRLRQPQCCRQEQRIVRADGR